jgi:hypothetical protein
MADWNVGILHDKTIQLRKLDAHMLQILEALERSLEH